MTEQRRSVSWGQVSAACVELGSRLRGEAWIMDRLRKGGMVAVTRGGLVPAAILAQVMGINRVETFAVRSRPLVGPGEAQRLLVIGDPPALPLSTLGDGWLVVDDLVDGGGTLARVRDILPRALFAVVFAKPLGLNRARPEFWQVPASQDTWLDFPWEVPEHEKGAGTDADP